MSSAVPFIFYGLVEVCEVESVELYWTRIDRVAWHVYLACLRSHVLRAYCNCELKQAILITLFGRRPNN